MKTTCISPLLCLFLSARLCAQVGYSDAGSRANALANTSVTYSDVFCAQNNQAGLAYVENTSAGLSTQNFFLLDGGINAHYGVFAIPVKDQGSIGISINYFGDKSFNQSKIGIGYGRKLADNVAAGIQLDYISTNTLEAGSGHTFTFDIGIIYKPVKTLTVGAKAFNPIRSKTGLDYTEELPSIINIGMAYKPSDKIQLCAEGELNLEDALRIKLSAEYHVIDELFLRGGYLSNPSMFTCGLGVDIKSLTIDLSTQFHQQLGATPGLGLSYKF